MKEKIEISELCKSCKNTCKQFVFATVCKCPFYEQITGDTDEKN